VRAKYKLWDPSDSARAPSSASQPPLATVGLGPTVHCIGLSLILSGVSASILVWPSWCL